MRIFALLALAALSLSAEWWGFRGPGGNGVLESKKLPVKWSATENIAWKAEIPGKGHSQPIIVGDRVFLTSSIEGDPIPGQKAPEHTLGGKPFVHPDTTAEDRKVTLLGLAYDARTGKLLWNKTLYEGPVYDGRHKFNTYASPTPVSDGKRVFFYFESQGLYAMDFDGKQLWKASVGNVKKVGLGAGTSPVLAGDRLILQVDEDSGENSFISAISTRNGELLWKVKRDAQVTWNTPAYVKHNGVDMVIAAGTEATIAYDPKTGKEIWRGEGVGQTAAATPVTGHGMIFPNGYIPKKRVLGMKLDVDAKDRTVWTFDKGTAYIPSPVLYGDYLYLMAPNGSLTCLEAKTGKLVYEGKRVPKAIPFHSSPVAFDGKILLTSEEGETFVVKAGPEHEIIGTNSVGERVVASLALDGDSIYIRGDKHLYRIKEK
ncbi:MAG: PQQ-binding-like beta-propeller repeat protein [Bryobacteraceae bacterium]|nr:PQQ-binding-like beta-propeller repeat protein [Bryobacteraceae bacterium]